MNTIKAVIFDMDGLMFDTESIYYKSNQTTADAIGMPFNYAFYERFIGSSEKDFFAALHMEQEDESLVASFIEQSKEDIEKALLAESLPHKKGLISLLDYLKEQGIEMVVASSTERNMVEKLLSNAGISAYFSGVVGGDEVENSKPDPAIFLKALNQTSAKSEEAIVLEDSLNGIRAAHAAGIPVIMVPDLISPTPEAEEKAAAVVEDLIEVISFIKDKNKR